MDAHSIFRCKSCQHAMKFSAEKAGKKAKCPKCGTLVVIQRSRNRRRPIQRDASSGRRSDHVRRLAPMPENVQTQAEANKKVDDMFDDGGPATYEAKVDEELVERQKQRAEEEEAQKTAKKPKKKLPKVGPRSRHPACLGTFASRPWGAFSWAF